MRRFYEWAGGRKVGLGLIGVILGIPMAWLLGASFIEWAGFTAGGLGWTQVTIAYEDSRRASGGPS